MEEIKLVFVQANKEDVNALGSILESIKQTDYYFLIVPPDVNVLSKKEVLEMLSRIPD